MEQDDHTEEDSRNVEHPSTVYPTSGNATRKELFDAICSKKKLLIEDCTPYMDIEWFSDLLDNLSVTNNDLSDMDSIIWTFRDYIIIHSFPGENSQGIILRNGEVIVYFGEGYEIPKNSTSFVNDFLSWYYSLNDDLYDIFC